MEQRAPDVMVPESTGSRYSIEPRDEGPRFSFDSGQWDLGRAPECHIRLRDFGVSRVQARLEVRGDGVHLVDLKSKGGTQVDGVPVQDVLLHDGAVILMGKFHLVFSERKHDPR